MRGKHWCQDCKHVLANRQCRCGNNWCPDLDTAYRLYREYMGDVSDFEMKVKCAGVIDKMERVYSKKTLLSRQLDKGSVLW